jgi:hypothetical protein
LITETMVKTYSLRAAHVRGLEGEHWQQLAASTEEFARNLASCVGTPVECLRISGSQEFYYVVFYSAQREGVIGCMKVRPDTRPIDPSGGYAEA